MSLSKVQPFLEEAFEFLRDREFSVTRQDWTKFCDSQGISLDQLKSAKLELLRQVQKIDDNSEQLKQIFCCDPFDGEIIKSLRDIWYEKAESQRDPFQKWYYDLSVHLLQIDTEELELSPKIVNPVTPPITQQIPTAKPINSLPQKTHQLRNIAIPSDL